MFTPDRISEKFFSYVGVNCFIIFEKIKINLNLFILKNLIRLIFLSKKMKNKFLFGEAATLDQDMLDIMNPI